VSFLAYDVTIQYDRGEESGALESRKFIVYIYIKKNKIRKDNI